MTTSVRYKNVANTLGAAFTLDNFPFGSDGDDKQLKIVKRIIAAADIGTGAGQIGNALGAIVDIIPPTTNVIWFQLFIFRPLAGVPVPYKNLQGVVVTPAVPVAQFQVLGLLGTDNTIRAIDAAQGGTAAIAAGDIITAFAIIGQKQDSADSMN
jgi:hypothetical protein